MTIQTINFNPALIENPDVTTRTFNSDYQVEDLEFHPEVTHGACITGLLRNGDGNVRMGFWDREGHNAVIDMPNLLQEKDVQEPDVRECWVNIYRSTETDHGFTVGSKTGTKEDMTARGLRNTSGTYICTVRIAVDLNGKVQAA